MPRRLLRIFKVPDAWEGWAVRILTIAIALVFVAVYILIGQMRALSERLDELEAFIADSRAQRTAFQNEETARQCRGLQEQGLSLEELRGLGC